MSGVFNHLMTTYDEGTLKVVELSEFIKDKLYFVNLNNDKDLSAHQSFKDLKSSFNDSSVYYLNVEDNLVYDSFFNDFGPLNLAMIYRFIGIVQEQFKTHKIVVYCVFKNDHKQRANAAFLICAYMIIVENWTARQTYATLSQQYKYQYIPFRDASCLLYTKYSVTIEECVNALYKAKWYGFFYSDDFDLDEYEKYETVEFGDMNWIVPSTLLAFSSPQSKDHIDKSGYQIHSPAFYYQYFKDNNIKHVVRLNSKRTYDAKCTFVAVANIQHTDLVFTDGTPPTDSILNIFLNLCERYINDDPDAINGNKNINGTTNTSKSGGAVAVHCKAGLGRTGCLIASYIVKHWSFTAAEAIAWIRICRPGSVIGTQQQWLIEKEEYLKTEGKQWRERRKDTVEKYKRFKNGVYSVKRHTSNTNTYEYVNPPPQSCLSFKEQPLSSSGKSSETECVETKKCNQTRLSSVLKNKLRSNNDKLLNIQKDVYVPNVRQKRSASTNDIPISKSFLTVKNSRRVLNSSTELSINTKKRINNTTPTIMPMTKSNSKTSLVGKKNTKAIHLNKPNTRSKTETKMVEESKTPSYTLATVASTARVSWRLRSQTCTK